MPRKLDPNPPAPDFTGLPEATHALAAQLNDREFALALHVLNGATYTEAYRLISPKCAKSTAEKAGSEIARRPKVANFIRRVRIERWREGAPDYWEHRQVLAEIMRDPEASHSDKTAATMSSARLAGYLDGAPPEEGVNTLDSLAAAIAPTLGLPYENTTVIEAELLEALEAPEDDD